MRRASATPRSPSWLIKLRAKGDLSRYEATFKLLIFGVPKTMGLDPYTPDALRASDSAIAIMPEDGFPEPLCGIGIGNGAQQCVGSLA
jgi:hypothetical protein